MITKSTEMAIQALLYLSRQEAGRWVPLQEFAQEGVISVTYMAKIMAMLSRGGVVRSQRGAGGGVQLGRPADQINLLQVVEACQGVIPEPYCQTPSLPGAKICGYHAAMLEFRASVTAVLSDWTVERLGSCPTGISKDGEPLRACKMFGVLSEQSEEA